MRKLFFCAMLNENLAPFKLENIWLNKNYDIVDREGINNNLDRNWTIGMKAASFLTNQMESSFWQDIHASKNCSTQVQVERMRRFASIKL